MHGCRSFRGRFGSRAFGVDMIHRFSVSSSRHKIELRRLPCVRRLCLACVISPIHTCVPFIHITARNKRYADLRQQGESIAVCTAAALHTPGTLYSSFCLTHHSPTHKNDDVMLRRREKKNLQPAGSERIFSLLLLTSSCTSSSLVKSPFPPISVKGLSRIMSPDVLIT